MPLHSYTITAYWNVSYPRPKHTPQRLKKVFMASNAKAAENAAQRELIQAHGDAYYVVTKISQGSR